MTVLEAINAVQERLGQRTSLNSDVRTELNLAQTYYESLEELPWFLQTRAFSIADSTMPLPAGFLSELVDEPLVRIITGEGRYIPLVKKNLWEVDAYRSASTSFPKYYVLEPTQIVLLPPPEQGYTVELVYMAADTPISSLADGGTNKWLTYAPLVLVNDAGYRVSMSLRSPETAQIFAMHLQEAQRAMWKRHYAMAQNARGVSLGG